MADQYAQSLEQVFKNLRESLIGVGREAEFLSRQFVQGVDNVNKQRFYRGVEQAIGVNIQSIIQNEDLTDILRASVSENVNLITSIPQEYLKNIESIVYRGTTSGLNATSMIEEIVKQGRSTAKRAKLIARDQTSKINSTLSQKRATNLGAEEYVWRTAGDERVRPNHATKNGKVFRYNNPPRDTGHPGHDIQCRCVAQPIIRV